MSLKQFITIAALLTLATSAWAAPDLIIPAAASTPGGNGEWQSEVTLHNAGNQEALVALEYHSGAGLASGPISLTVPARSTVVLADVVKNRFNSAAPAGAIVLDVDDLGLRKLGVTSRTFNLSPLGEFGQDIPAVPAGDAMSLGDTVILSAPANVATTRFNFGLYALEDTTVEWKLLRSNGTVAATVTRTYTAGTHTQHNTGVSSLLNATPENADTVHGIVKSGRSVFYGSSVNNATGDPSFVPASRTRENLSVEILGLDLDENGTVDVADADGDGVLDQTLTVYATGFPNYFRVVATDPEGSNLTYSLVSPPLDVRLIDDQGTVQWYPAADMRGEAGSLTIRVSDGVDASTLIIPVIFN